MAIKEVDANQCDGFKDLIKAVTSSEGGIKGIHVPADTKGTASITELRLMWDEDNPRLVFAPLCVHGPSGFWCVAAFYAPDEKDEVANFRGSLALSLAAGQPVVMFGDLALFCTDDWGQDGDDLKLTAPVKMPQDLAETLIEQFKSPQAFAVGPMAEASRSAGEDSAEIARDLIDAYDWGFDK